MHADMHAFTHTYTHKYIYTQIHTYTHTQTYIYKDMHAYICMLCICICDVSVVAPRQVLLDGARREEHQEGRGVQQLDRRQRRGAQGRGSGAAREKQSGLSSCGDGQGFGCTCGVWQRYATERGFRKGCPGRGAGAYAAGASPWSASQGGI